MIGDILFELQDKEYALFQAKLIPTIARDTVIGVRVPEIRALAKTLYKEGNYRDFLHELPHKYYDENMLHGAIIAEIKDYDECVAEVERFLPYVDNWAVCDTMRPKVFGKHKDDLINRIEVWVASKEDYTCRFGIEMLMNFFLDKDFKKEYLEIPARVQSSEYYVNMMVAWFFATALAKQWESSISFIEQGRLDTWTHNKTIQKARESFRITKEQKEYLKQLKK